MIGIGTIALLLALLAVAYVALMIWDAKHSTESAPRADMFVCDKHGAVPMKYAVQLDMAGITDNPISYCPFCYEDKVKGAKNVYAKDKR